MVFTEDPLRCWRIKVKTIDEEKTVIVNPSGFDSVLNNPKTVFVDIVSFGVLNEYSIDPIMLRG